MIGIEMKLKIPVHYQMGNPLQQGSLPCDLHIQSYHFDIVQRNLGYFFSIIKISQ
jgi:hypothetical protein